MSPHIILIGSIKGGVGKSTIACNMAVCASVLDGKKVLLIDVDKQASSYNWAKERQADDFDFATDVDLSNISNDFADYDYIIIDSGGRDTEVFRSAILAAHHIIVPVLAQSSFDVWATDDTLVVLREAAKVKNGFKVGLVLNQYVKNLVVAQAAKGYARTLATDFGVDLLKTTLGRRTIFQKSTVMSRGVVEIEKKGKGIAAQEITALWREIKGLIIYS